MEIKEYEWMHKQIYEKSEWVYKCINEEIYEQWCCM